MSKNDSIAVSTYLSHDIIERKIYLIRGKKEKRSCLIETLPRFMVYPRVI